MVLQVTKNTVLARELLIENGLYWLGFRDLLF